MKINEAGQSAAGACQRPGGPELTRRGLALCPFPAGGPVLDVGCGAGATVRLLRDLGCEALGLDRSKPAEEADFPFIQARAEDLPFAPETFSGIVCECVLSLCANCEGTLRGFWKACRPGAFLLLTDVYDRDVARREASPGTREELERALGATGWPLQHFEDHSPALRDYAAQRLWRGEECDFGGLKSLGYGLWVARKETL